MNMDAKQIAEAVGIGLLHFTWIASLLGAPLAVALHALRWQSPQIRYAVALAGFVLMALVPLATISASLAMAERPLGKAGPSRGTIGAVAPGGVAHPPTDPPMATSNDGSLRPDDTPTAVSLATGDLGPLSIPAATAALRSWLDWAAHCTRDAAPWLAAGWLAGVLILGLRLLGGAHFTRSLRRRGTAPLDPQWQSRLAQLCASAGINPGIRVVRSSVAIVPLVVGWLRPTVLMPAAVFTGLTTHQVELLLAHELAHVKRLDPLVNLFQAVVETLLFFHPVVWWLSRRIREERELCCDDLALSLCGGRAEYAQALLQLAETSSATPALALSSQGSPLLRRVHRILGLASPAGRLNTPGLLVVAMTALLCTVASGLVWFERSAGPGAADTIVAPMWTERPLPLNSAEHSRDASGAAVSINPELPDEILSAATDESVNTKTDTMSMEGISEQNTSVDALPSPTPQESTSAVTVEALDTEAHSDWAVADLGPQQLEVQEAVVSVTDPEEKVADAGPEQLAEAAAPEVADSLSVKNTESVQAQGWPDLAEMRITDHIDSEHISDVLDRWGKEFHLYFHLDPSIVMAPGVAATQDLYQNDGLVADQQFNDVPLDHALPQLLAPLGLAHWYGTPKFAEDHPIYPSVWINTSANLEAIRNAPIPYFQFQVAVATVSADAREACLDAFAGQIGNERGKVLRFDGESSAMGNATPEALLALLDEYEATEIRQNARMIASAADSWWPLSVRSVLVEGSAMAVTGGQSGEGAPDSGPTGGCLFPHRSAENTTWNPFTDGTCGNRISTPPSVQVNCEDALLPFGQEWMAACASPSVVVCMDQIFDPPLVSHTNVTSKRAGRRGTHLPRPDPPSPENPADVTLYHEGTLLGLGARQREDFIQVQFFGQYRLRGQGAVPWQAILTRYAVKQGDIMGFFLPADDRDDCLLVLLRVEPYTTA